MKLNDYILETAKNFYINTHTLDGTVEMIWKNYKIKVCREAVRKRFKNMGFPLRTREETSKLFLRKKLSKNEINNIIKLYRQTNSIKRVSRQLNFNRKIVTRTLREHGIKILDKETAVRLANIKKERITFGGDEKEKSYIMGLVEGDLTALKKSKYTIRLTVSSTHRLFLNK